MIRAHAPGSRFENPNVQIPVRLVAAAGGGHESAPIQHCDLAPAISNQAALF